LSILEFECTCSRTRHILGRSGSCSLMIKDRVIHRSKHSRSQVKAALFSRGPVTAGVPPFCDRNWYRSAGAHVLVFCSGRMRANDSPVGGCGVCRRVGDVPSACRAGWCRGGWRPHVCCRDPVGLLYLHLPVLRGLRREFQRSFASWTNRRVARSPRWPARVCLDTLSFGHCPKGSVGPTSREWSVEGKVCGHGAGRGDVVE
jgi:hypothetical protein